MRFFWLTAAFVFAGSAMGCMAAPESTESGESSLKEESAKLHATEVGLAHKAHCDVIVDCIHHTHWDATACACVPNGCVENVICIDGKHWDSEKCKCVATCEPSACIFAQQWDPTTCRCECREPAIACAPGSHYDPTTCECEPVVCDPLVCPPGSVWDSATCACEHPVCDPLVCTPPLQWNADACACVVLDPPPPHPGD